MGGLFCQSLPYFSETGPFIEPGEWSSHSSVSAPIACLNVGATDSNPGPSVFMPQTFSPTEPSSQACKGGCERDLHLHLWTLGESSLTLEIISLVEALSETGLPFPHTKESARKHNGGAGICHPPSSREPIPSYWSCSRHTHCMSCGFCFSRES